MNKLEIEWLNAVNDIAEENKYHITNCVRFEYLEFRLEPTFISAVCGLHK